MDTSHMTFDDWLDDLCVRFLNNVPLSELKDFSRIGFYVEEAQWFYEDFIRPLDPTGLPHLKPRDFSLRILQRSPATKSIGPEFLARGYDEFISYKKRVPVRGLILLNEALDSVVLVKGWTKSASWSFPRGKINQEEDDLDCAIREAYEETGFNVEEAGLIPQSRKVKYFEHTIRDQHLRLYVVPNVPADTPFEPRTRKEISKIQWYKLAELPGRTKRRQGQDNTTTGSHASKFYMVAPFMELLTRWVKLIVKKRLEELNSLRTGSVMLAETEDVVTEGEGTCTEAGHELPHTDTQAAVHLVTKREVKKPLRIQPSTTDFQTGATDHIQEGGQILLNMLQWKNAVPQELPSTTVRSAALVLHTPVDYSHDVVLEARTHHDHQPTQRLRSDNQAHAPFPSQPDVKNQLLSVLGVPGNPMESVSQPIQVTAQSMAGLIAPNGTKRPVLVHPQPLPPQANHVLTDAMATIPIPETKIGQMNQETNLAVSLTEPASLAQQVVVNARQPPGLLDNMLNEFGKVTGPTSPLPLRSISVQQEVAVICRPSQHRSAQNLALLASTYASNQIGNPTVLNSFSRQPQLGAAQAVLRPSNVPESQRNALLSIFKQSVPLPAPRREHHPNWKENSSFDSSQNPGFDSSPKTTISAAVDTNDGLMQAERGHGLPCGARYMVGPEGRDGSDTQPQAPPGHVADSIGAENSFQATGDWIVPPSTLFSSTQGNRVDPGQLNAHAKIASLSTFIHRRRDEADPQQLQKLMSLFRTPSTTKMRAPAMSTDPPSVLISQGTESGAFSMGQVVGQLSNPGSDLASRVASPGIDRAGNAMSTSRNSSQPAPISPENEKFLLNYLKTVSSTAKGCEGEPGISL